MIVIRIVWAAATRTMPRSSGASRVVDPSADLLADSLPNLLWTSGVTLIDRRAINELRRAVVGD
jgi:hypothetical protein